MTVHVVGHKEKSSERPNNLLGRRGKTFETFPEQSSDKAWEGPTIILAGGGHWDGFPRDMVAAHMGLQYCATFEYVYV